MARTWKIALAHERDADQTEYLESWGYDGRCSKCGTTSCQSMKHPWEEFVRLLLFIKRERHMQARNTAREKVSDI